MTTILLGTVALEPNRWGMADPGGGATIRASAWLPRIADAGFDGIELWERHVTEADDVEVEKLLTADVPIEVFNTYVGFDDDEPDQWATAADWVGRTSAHGVKYNVGNDPALEGAYVERVATWLAAMPPSVRLLCECHVAISIAEEPAVAARMLAAIGPPERSQAIVHLTSETHDHIKARFDAYGDRIGHIHLNDPPGWDERGAVSLEELQPELGRKIELLRSYDFAGTWTVEFVKGTMTPDDEPGYLMDRAAEDLAVLRALLD